MRVLALIFVLGLSATVFAQSNRYFVSFKDKNNSPYSVSDPGKFLSSKSIARRTKQGVSITNEDLPVNPSYISQVKALGIQTYFASKWWNGVLVQTDQAIIENT